MAAKYKLTRPELKRFRDALARYQRFLPTLQLKQQQLQMAVRDVIRELHQARQTFGAARDRFEPYRGVLNDIAGVNVSALATPDDIKTTQANIAGVNIPVFESVSFPPARYSLFATPAWVDQTLKDLRDLNEKQARADITEKKYALLQRELTKISQRVNLF
ncbi:MAG: hypothetical protein JW709_09155, partial [Sedimentisphaerales bacterium]|nr:hypothetical protein [Sedimentisphaerales bacterium]